MVLLSDTTTGPLSLCPGISVQLVSVRSQEVDLISKVANLEVTCGSNVMIYL